MTLLALLCVLAAEPAPAPPIWTTPNRAAFEAAADCGGLSAVDRPFVRYVWVPDLSRETAAAVSYSLNAAVSTATTIQHPAPVAGGLLLRVDLRRFAPQTAKLKSLLVTWEKLAATDPWFHAASVVKVATQPYKADDGKTYDFKFQRQFALAADVNALLTLRTFTGSECPVVEARWLLGKMLTTLDGGLYYQFRGIGKSTVRGKTDEQVFFESLGATGVNLGERPADEKAGIFKSGVTGKPRVVVAFYGTNVRPSAGLPLVTATLDIADGQVKRGQHPAYNLVKFDFAASEVIGSLPNGLPIYALFNNKGELQDSVPDNIARDGTIPFPETSRLQPAIGCIRCHGPNDGLKPFANDVRTLLRAPEAQPTIDLTQLAKKSLPDVLDQIQGLYTGDLSPVLDQARNAHHTAAYRATGGIWGEKSSSSVAARIGELYAGYFYAPVTPAVACRELGFVLGEPSEADAQAAFARAVPPLGTGDDPTIIALRQGIAVVRADWEHVLQDCLLRSR